MSQLKSPQKLPAADPTTKPEPQQSSGEAAQDLVQKSLAMARLEGQISKDFDAYQQRPRKEIHRCPHVRSNPRPLHRRLAHQVEHWAAISTRTKQSIKTTFMAACR